MSEVAPLICPEHIGVCRDCGGAFSACGDPASDTHCGPCSATTHLPRCGHHTVVPLGLGSIDSLTCQRPFGHGGHHTYGRRRA